MQFKIGDTVRKTKGSKWQGKIVGQYSTALTPNGYAVESDTETGSVQIYPASALELAAAGGVSCRADELIACLEAEVKSRDARLLEMDAQCMLAGVALDLVVAEATKLRAELAACRDGYAELESDNSAAEDENASLRRVIDSLKSEIAAIKAQEPVAVVLHRGSRRVCHCCAGAARREFCELCDDAAPAAKQVVMPVLPPNITGEWGDAYRRGWLSYEREYSRLNAADQEGDV